MPDGTRRFRLLVLLGSLLMIASGFLPWWHSGGDVINGIQLPARTGIGLEGAGLAIYGAALVSLLLLDEPSMGLSPILTEQIFRIIGEINEQGTTVLLVEQNALMALNVAQRGYVLQTGKIILSDTAANLAANEQVRQAYLGEI